MQVAADRPGAQEGIEVLVGSVHDGLSAGVEGGGQGTTGGAHRGPEGTGGWQAWYVESQHRAGCRKVTTKLGWGCKVSEQCGTCEFHK